MNLQLQRETKCSTYRSRKYLLNENIFNSGVNTEGQAYILGLLYSDGWVSTTKKNSHTIGLMAADRELPEYLCEILEANYPIKEIAPRKITHSTLYGVVIESKNLIEALTKLGYVPLKANRTYIPIMPAELIRHFLRGLWDGDGSAGWRSNGSKEYFRMTLTGYFELLTEVDSYVKSIICTNSSIRKKGNIFSVCYTANANKLHKHLYENCTYALSRKADVL